MKPVHFLLPAEHEMIDSAMYYESQAQGLGLDFLENVNHAVKDISKFPERWAMIRSDIRRRIVHRFPYGVLYKVDASEIIVVAVGHLHRHPTYWIERIA